MTAQFTRRSRWPVAIAALVVSFAAGPLWAEDFTWRGSLAPGLAFEVKGVNGSIAAAASTSGDIELVARKHGRRDDPARVTIEVVEHADGITVCAVYPSASGEPNRCAPGSEGRMRVRDNDVQVDFDVKLPPGVRFAARTVNGSVKAEGLDERVDVSTVNGSITVATTGLASAKTVNGSITASVGRTDWDGALEFSTVNGAITVHLPEHANTTVRARTVNGGITTDFPLVVQGRMDHRQLDATIGSGGRALDLKTVNGAIRLKRLS